MKANPLVCGDLNSRTRHAFGDERLTVSATAMLEIKSEYIQTNILIKALSHTSKISEVEKGAAGENTLFLPHP